jgi:hypothetical protein
MSDPVIFTVPWGILPWPGSCSVFNPEQDWLKDYRKLLNG